LAPTSDAELQRLFERLALEAGAAIMRVHAGRVRVEEKADRSPVTEADRAAEAVILAGLRAACPALPVIAEEEASAGLSPLDPGNEFILVDPLDGTREFIRGGADFTVNIALIRNGAPVAGVVYAPALPRFFSAAGGVAEEIKLAPDGARLGARGVIVVRCPPLVPRVVASRSHRTPETESFLAGFPGAEIVSIGSSLKFCLLAAGEADLYPRFGPTMEWDTAAGDAILRSAGGITHRPDGSILDYGKRGREPSMRPFQNPFFIATASRFDR
jgi:3'(2'), 5'-bisphosphate nucleotidase